MFFDSWQGLGRVLLVGFFAYAGLVLLLRVSGNRTLSKLNAFDFVVTIALGSTLATVLLSKSVALAEGLLAFGLLIGLQFVVTWGSVRSARFSSLLRSEPVLLCRDGAFLPQAMRRARIIQADVLAVLRSEGVSALEEVEAVILESDGTLTVLRRTEHPKTTLQDVECLKRPA